MTVDGISQKPPQRRGLAAFFPILAWLPKYNRSWLRPDLIAGITVVALLVPEGMAYAELAGMPPQTIFYAAPAALLLYAIFRHVPPVGGRGLVGAGGHVLLDHIRSGAA